MYLDELGIAPCASPIYISPRPLCHNGQQACPATPRRGYVLSIMCPRMRQQIFQVLGKDLSSTLEPI